MVMTATKKGTLNEPLPAFVNVLQLLFIISAAYLVVPTHFVIAGPPTITPRKDHFVPANSLEDVTYSCSVEGGTVFWGINTLQISSEVLFTDVEERGLSIQPRHPDNPNSSISITQMARTNSTELNIQCLSMTAGALGSIGSDTYKVVTFGIPSAPRNLKLNQISYGGLILTWDRPSNMPYHYNDSEVKLVYNVTLRSTDKSGRNFEASFNTPNQSLYIDTDALVNSSECELFQFTTQGWNLAGTGHLSIPIIDTIPISPDVRNISEELTVDSVALEPLTIGISFPHVRSCSVNFTLRNYTVEIDNKAVLELSYDEAESYIEQGKVRLKLNSTSLPSGVGLDSSHQLAIAVCHDVTCKSSNPVNFYTTDVQDVVAIFYKNQLYLNCSFANNSQAYGCVVKLSLRDSNETEDFEISHRMGSSCNETNNRLEAYSGLIVIDIEADGVEGNVSRPVIPREVYSLNEFMNITGCELEPTSGPNIVNEPDIAVPVTVGVVISVIVVIIGIIIVAIIIVIVYKKKGITFRLDRQQENTDDFDGKANIQADSGQIASESRKIDAECKVRGDVLTIKLKESVRFRTVTIIEKF